MRDQHNLTVWWDRSIQLLLLALIAGGLVFIVTTLRSGSDAATSFVPPGTRSGAPDAAPVGEGANINLVAVETSGAVRETIREYIRVNGDTVAQRSVTIYPDVGGKIVTRMVSPGQHVRQDQTLAVVDPSQPGQRYVHSPVISTIAGTVTDVNVQVGDTVNQQTAVATIGDLSRLEIVTYVPERYVASARTGMTADISFQAFPNETFPGKVVQVSPVLDPQSRTVEMKLILDGADPRIKVGMFASIRLVIAEARDIIAVPATAVTSHYDQSVVYVVGDDGTTRRREVTTGLRSRGLVQILSGLTEAEQVVTAGVGNVTDGTTVRVVNVEASR